MRLITLDAAAWKTYDDFYGALLKAVGAPEWHGRNINALIDSMVWGGINAVEPPYTVRILNADAVPPAVREEIELAANAIQEEQRGDLTVRIEIGGRPN